jgi:hyperosmotically inducible protein
VVVKLRLLLGVAVLALHACTSGGSQSSPQPQLSAAESVAKDGVILAAVKTKLSIDDPNSTTTVGVAVHDGAVTLKGSVLSAAAKTKLVADARGVDGVKNVVDELSVNPNGPRPSQQLGDLALAARIHAALAAQVGITHVGVHVDRGVVTLDGNVPDQKTRETAVATARGTSGVRNVVDRIRVQHS